MNKSLRDENKFLVPVKILSSSPEVGSGFFYARKAPGLSLFRRQGLVIFLCGLIIFTWQSKALARPLIASWYSIQSLKSEGTWNRTHGRMANGKLFQDSGLTAATRLFPLGSVLLVRNIANGKTVKVTVSDRIGKRFAETRIDLSYEAMRLLDGIEQGLVSVNVEIIK